MWCCIKKKPKENAKIGKGKQDRIKASFLKLKKLEAEKIANQIKFEREQSELNKQIKLVSEITLRNK